MESNDNIPQKYRSQHKIYTYLESLATEHNHIRIPLKTVPAFITGLVLSYLRTALFLVRYHIGLVGSFLYIVLSLLHVPTLVTRLIPKYWPYCGGSLTHIAECWVDLSVAVVGKDYLSWRAARSLVKKAEEDPKQFTESLLRVLSNTLKEDPSDLSRDALKTLSEVMTSAPPTVMSSATSEQDTALERLRMLKQLQQSVDNEEV